MTLRRYTPLKPSAGTRWPPDVLQALRARDSICVGRVLGFPPENCYGGLEPDHIRASGGIGMKSRSTLDNGAMLCANHHRYKTEHGRAIRPRLLAYVEACELYRRTVQEPEHVHVEPVNGCARCIEVFG